MGLTVPWRGASGGNGLVLSLLLWYIGTEERAAKLCSVRYHRSSPQAPPAPGRARRGR